MTVVERTVEASLDRDSGIYRFAATRLNLDVEVRYRAVARIIKGLCLQKATILELGAGSVSVGRYLRRQVVSVDPALPQIEEPWTIRILGSGCSLPFPDRTWDLVCSIDMLEHIPEASREQALREMVRVARRAIVLAVPTGSQAFDQDCSLNEYHVQQHGVGHRFGVEHIKFGLPNRGKVVQLLSKAANETGRKLEFKVMPNNNLKLRSAYMKLTFSRSLLARAMYMALYPLAFLGRLHDKGECYRSIFVGEFGPE
jgi:hypothetical protein